MEKNRIRPVKAGKGMRMSYSRQKEVLEMPNLIEVQKDSYKWFLDEGLKEVFDDISPIADYSGHLSLEFVDFTLCEDDVKYTIPECKERDATYAAPLKVKVRLHNKETDEINEHEIFMGDLPLMTETGTFVINGAERVIVSQLVRSPGIYYGRHRVQCPALHHPRRPRGADRVFSEGMPPAVPVVLQPRKLGAAAAGGGLSDQVHRAQGLRCLR